MEIIKTKVKIIENCYFRSPITEDSKKLFIQLTTKCNMRCKHCFVSAENTGIQLDMEEFKKNMFKLRELDIKKVTLTGGEPLLFDKIYDIIELLKENGVKITICSNAFNLNEDKIKKFKHYGVKFNVSLDSIEEVAYEEFRGKKKSFKKVINNIKLLKKYGILKGILVTPNKLSSIDDYIKLILKMDNIGAEYVLFNPLAMLGRGKENICYGVTQEYLITLQKKIEKLNISTEVVLIKFPKKCQSNLNNKIKCPRKNLIYMYANGEIVTCPYMDFADKGEKVGNLYSENELNFDFEIGAECEL